MTFFWKSPPYKLDHAQINPLIENINNRVFSQFQQVGDPSSLPPNYFADNVLLAMTLSRDAESNSFLCDNCDAGDLAETRYKECEIFICHFCSEYHRRSHATKSHSLASISDLKSSKPADIARRLQCVKHKEEINLFWKTCDLTICRDCIIADHREHKYSKIEEVSLEKKNNLQKVLDNARAQKAKITGGISYVEQRAECVRAKQESTVDQIIGSFEKVTAMIENKKQELIDTANSLSNLKQEQLREQCRKLKNTLEIHRRRKLRRNRTINSKSYKKLSKSRTKEINRTEIQRPYGVIRVVLSLTAVHTKR